MAGLKLKVTGMHCNSCVMLIQDILEENGAKDIKADFKKGTVELKYDETKLNEIKIKQLIKSQGYGVE
jgi:copper chaperone CopZ